MKAIVCTKYGPPEVLELRDVEKPVPKNNELLIRIRATTVTAGDCEIRSSKVKPWLWLPIRLWMGLIRPRGKAILGTELAGEIEAVGQDVASFKPEDKVFGSTGMNFGTNAEYVCITEDADLAKKPDNISFEEAAALPFGGRDALHFLRKGDIEAGGKVLIVGAGGSIGTFAVQLAKLSGAEVTAVDSTRKLDMLRSIGADNVIDYTKEKYVEAGERYDVIFDTVGKSPYGKCMKALKRNGRYLLANPGFLQMFRAPISSIIRGKKVVVGAAEGGKEDLLYLGRLAEAGQIKSVIDSIYPLEEIVEAHSYVETGEKKGNVAITIR